MWTALGPVEGGYSNDPNDSGGETMWGITAVLARAHGYTGEMKDLQRDDAKAIAHEEFYAPLRLDAVAAYDWHLAAELFDCGFNMGRSKAGHWLQLPLSLLEDATLSVDGHIGDETLACLVQFSKHRGPQGAKVLLKCVAALRAVDFMNQTQVTPAKRGDLYGWLDKRVAQDGPVMPA